MADTALRLCLPALQAAATERDKIQRIAVALAKRVAQGGNIYTFGAGHSQSIAAEFCSRAGGLAHFTAMSLEDLREDNRKAHLQLSDSNPERDPSNGRQLLSLYEVTARDALLIASNSGRNAAVIEMALQARAMGTYVAAIVSGSHCAHESSRHPSGHKLVDVVDEWIDNCGVPGDAIIPTRSGMVGATSTIAGALIAQLISIALVEQLEAQELPAQVIASANIDQRQS
jgi:uncharacterized phosphosugar-binding protein